MSAMISDFRLLLNSKRHILIVSLPDNDLELARAAIEAGADVVKLHVNVTHKATGRAFPSWPAARRNIERICDLGICVGIVPGDENRFAAEEHLLEMQEMGISFIDFFINDAPTYVLNTRLAKMVALNDFSQALYVQAVQSLGANALELSIVPKEHYGERLTLWDLTRYSYAAKNSPIPCFVPSEKKIQPDEVTSVLACGIKGLIIGSIVTGNSLKEFVRAVQAFRRHMDSF
ncbi:MAG TPA: hypothetical protein PLK95_06425 [Pseudothermotoga sp.]|nr:hypothetical protein [Pseudothermotoga sp.]